MSEQRGRGGDFEAAGLLDLRSGNGMPETHGRVQDEALLAAVKLTRMAMALTDPTQQDNPLVYVNPAFLDLTGYEEQEIIGRNCRFLQGPDTDPIITGQVRQAITAHESISVEIYNYRRDGRGFWNALYICPVFNTEGRLVHFFASQMDVTRLKEAEPATSAS